MAAEVELAVAAGPSLAEVAVGGCQAEAQVLQGATVDPTANVAELPAPPPPRGRRTGRRVAKGQADAWPPRGREISRRVAAAPPRAPPPRGRRPRNRRVVAEARPVAAADPIEEVEERKAAKDRAAEGAERIAEEVREGQ